MGFPLLRGVSKIIFSQERSLIEINDFPYMFPKSRCVKNRVTVGVCGGPKGLIVVFDCGPPFLYDVTDWTSLKVVG